MPNSESVAAALSIRSGCCVRRTTDLSPDGHSAWASGWRQPARKAVASACRASFRLEIARAGPAATQPTLEKSENWKRAAVAETTAARGPEPVLLIRLLSLSK